MNWFMDTAMDGIVGGVIGGLVTGGTVWLTLRHERKMRESERREAAWQEVHAAVARLRITIYQLYTDPPQREGVAMEDRLVWLGRVQEGLFVAMAAVRTYSDGLFYDLQTAVEMLLGCSSMDPELFVNQGQVMRILGALTVSIQRWQVHPDTYHAGTFEVYLTQLESHLDGGES